MYLRIMISTTIFDVRVVIEHYIYHVLKHLRHYDYKNVDHEFTTCNLKLNPANQNTESNKCFISIGPWCLFVSGDSAVPTFVIFLLDMLCFTCVVLSIWIVIILYGFLNWYFTFVFNTYLTVITCNLILFNKCGDIL